MGRKLHRSREERQLAGVCGGLARFLGLDATLVRLFFVFLALVGGHGLLVYLVMAIFVPEAPRKIIFEDDGPLA